MAEVNVGEGKVDCWAVGEVGYDHGVYKRSVKNSTKVGAGATHLVHRGAHATR